MKIKFKKNFLLKTGEVPANKEIDIDDALAKSFIKNGYAIEVKPVKQAEKGK